jgi:hypothetical protein
MIVFWWSIGLVLLAFTLHVIIWKIRIPYRQTKAIVLIFLGVLACLLGAAFVLSQAAPGWQPFLPTDIFAYGHIALFVISFLLAYIITYSALEAESPTLTMVRKILAAGPRGLDKTSFDQSLTADLLLVPRCQDLLRDKLATLDADRYKLTPQGKLIAKLVIHYRRLMGAGTGG